MLRLLINGVNGRLGHTLVQVAQEYEDIAIVAGIDISAKCNVFTFPVYEDITLVKEAADVLIDFSRPEATEKILNYCVQKNIGAVICTTGLTDREKGFISEASKSTPVFFSANMSLGVNLIMSLAKKAAAVLDENFDIEIVEKHHNLKVDSPSGTALVLADAINESLSEKHEYVFGRHDKNNRRTKNEIGIHAVRGGTVVGEHDIMFFGNDEVITITHAAHSKNVFAVGALRAAQFIGGKQPDLYNMDDIFNVK